MIQEVHSQTSTLSVEREENLTSLLEKIAIQNQVLFAYPSDLISEIIIDPVEISYNSVDQLMDELFAGKSLEFYKADERKYLIRPVFVSPHEPIEIKGTISDEENGISLPLASIFFEDLSYGVLSNNLGEYTFIVSPDETRKVIISYLGYRNQSLSIEQLRKSATIRLKTDSYQLETPLIEYVLPPIIETKRIGLITDTDKLAGVSSSSGLFGKDLLRYLQLLAGVSAYEDNRVDLKIRGSNSESTHIILDGMPLYNVSHYYGIFSSINSDFVESIELYKNAQPIQYEGRGGGMVIMKSDQVKRDDHSFNINLLTSSFTLDFPLSKRVSFKLSGRSSYRNVNDASILDLNPREQENIDFANQQSTNFISNQPDFRFYDLNSTLSYKSKELDLFLNIFRSYDKLSNNYNLEFNLQGKEFERQLFNHDETWQNSSVSLVARKSITDKFSIYLSGYATEYNFNSALNSELPGAIGNNMISSGNSNEIVDKGIRAYLKYDNTSSQFVIGTEYKHLDVNHQLEAEFSQKLINYKDRLGFYSMFSSYGLTLGKLFIEAGLRVPVHNSRNHTKLLYSPQLIARYRIGDFQYLKSSISRTNQILREIEYETRLGQTLSFYQISENNDIPILRTDNYMLGYGMDQGLWGVDVELFYKNMKGNLLVSTESPGFNLDQGPRPLGVSGYQVFKGDRRVYGIDLSFNYRNSNYTSWLAYTLSWNEDRFPRVFKGNYFSSQDDRRHQLKWIHQWELNNWTFNTNFVYTSGKTYLALEQIQDRRPREMLNQKEVLNMLPDYFRWDIGATYNFNIIKKRAQLGLSVFNILNRRNLKYVQYAFKLETQHMGSPKNIIIGTESELLGRSLNLDFTFMF